MFHYVCWVVLHTEHIYTSLINQFQVKLPFWGMEILVVIMTVSLVSGPLKEITFHIKIFLEDLARLLTLDSPFTLCIAWIRTQLKSSCVEPVEAWIWDCGPGSLDSWIVCLCAYVVAALWPCSSDPEAAISQKSWRAEVSFSIPALLARLVELKDYV